jgi:hypothetical protein
MRMVHYFSALAVLVAPALLATAVSGIWLRGTATHLSLGLFTAVLAVATHTLVIVFMIVTGRVLKAAMKSRALDEVYLGELNEFFARKSAYPAAVLAAAAVVATGVLGYAQRGFGLTPTVHMLVGLGAVLLNLWALGLEHRTLRTNQSLIDRTAEELDRLDREQPVEPLEGGEPMRFTPSVRWLLAAGVAWGPYLYWGLVVWRGSFDRLGSTFLVVSAAASAFCLVCAWLARGLVDEPPGGGEATLSRRA